MTKTMMATQGIHTVEMDIHKGEALLHLAGTYPELFQVIEEGVQNSLDKNASDIRVTLNRKQRRIAIRDNGDGIDRDGFNQVLKSVGKSIKVQGSLGRFGLGLVSPLGKCEKFTFVSCPRPERSSYVQWTLHTENIRSQKEVVSIPAVNRHDLAYQDQGLPQLPGKSGVWWRSEVDIYNFVNDGVIANVDIDQLKQSILTKFSSAMLRNKTKICLTFTDEKGEVQERKFSGDSFTGSPLPEVVITLKDVGKVTFRMYLATKRQREARENRKIGINIRFGEMNNDYRVTFASFGKSVSNSDLGPESETLEALRSGIFEGEILGENIKFTKERTYFVRDDALVDLYIAIDQWYKQYGKQHYYKAKRESRDERYQKLGIRSLESLSQLLNETSPLADALKRLASKGTVGTGHADPANRVVNGEQACPSKSVRGGPNKERTATGMRLGSTPHGERENKNHMPLSVQGPDGNHRRIVKSNSTGLQFRYDAMAGSRELWELDREYGIITFNITHPDWVACDVNDAMICTLQEHVTIQILTLETMSDRNSYLVQRKSFNDYTGYFVKLLTQKGGNICRKTKPKKG